MKYPLTLLFFCICFFSCELSPPAPECHTIAPFDTLTSGSRVYQDAAIQVLESAEPIDFRYFFKTFVEREGKDYMTVNFRNDKLCFDGDVLVEKWDKLKGMKKVNGKSYPNELVHLSWSIEDREGQKMIVYQDMNWIID